MKARGLPCQCLLFVELFLSLSGPLAVHPVEAEDDQGHEEEQPRAPANCWNMDLVRRKYSTAYLFSSRSAVGCVEVQDTEVVQGPEPPQA